MSIEPGAAPLAIHRSQTFEGWARDFCESAAAKHYDNAINCMLKALRPPPGSVVLDAGCGTGVHSVRVAKAGFRLKSIDVSSVAVGKAKTAAEAAGYASHIDVMEADLIKLPFADETFHTAFAWGVVIHIDQVEEALKELVRVLKPGGRLALQVTNSQSADFAVERVARLVLRRPFVARAWTPWGFSGWDSDENGKLWNSWMNVGHLASRVEGMGLRLVQRRCSELTELQRRFNGTARRFIRWLNEISFVLSLPARLAATNLLVFEKNQQPPRPETLLLPRSRATDADSACTSRTHRSDEGVSMDKPGSDTAFAGSIPEVYESHLVPLIFEPYAADLASRVAALKPARVLETAAGTGVVTRAMARALSAQVEIIATDLNPPMLDRAAAIGTSRPVQWKQADARHLPFGDASFDVVVCQFGVMFFPEKAHAFAEARRVLRPGGTFMFNVWDRIEENDFSYVVTNALARLFPDDPPRFMARTPHGYFDRETISRDLANAGFTAAPSFETIAARSRAASASVPAIAYCHGTPLRNEIEARSGASLAEATSACAAAIAERFGDGPVDGKIQAHVVVIER